MQKAYTVLAWTFGALLAFIIYEENTGDSMAPVHVIRAISHGDKIAHFMLFGIMSFLLNLAFSVKRFEFGRYSIYRGSTVVSLFVVVEEFSQRFIATRSFDYYDLAADFGGIVLFAFLTALYVNRSSQKLT